jgi:hypothetical protein
MIVVLTPEMRRTEVLAQRVVARILRSIVYVDIR